MVLPDDLLDGVVNSKPGCVEQVLALMRDKVCGGGGGGAFGISAIQYCIL